jgi:20S proteasome alpha/beta subunit
MTVGIAVICEDGNTVVVVADRGIVFGSPQLQAERVDPKIEILNKSNLLMFSGGFQDFDIIRRAVGTLSDATFQEIVSRLNTACEQRVHDNHSRALRRLGLSLEALGSDALSRATKSKVVADLQSQTLPGAFLIAGVDDKKASISTASDQTPNCHDTVGFCAVGSAEQSCLPLMTARGANRAMSAGQAAYVAYEAKRAAETSYGIGKQTDIAIVGVGRPAELLQKEVIEELEKVYARRNRLDELGVDSIVTPTPKLQSDQHPPS